MLGGVPLGFVNVTGLSTVKGITAPAGTVTVVIVAESQDVRWRDDGTNPTASVGMLLAAGAEMTYTGDISKLKFIETTASATLDVSCYNA